MYAIIFFLDLLHNNTLLPMRLVTKVYKLVCGSMKSIVVSSPRSLRRALCTKYRESIEPKSGVLGLGLLKTKGNGWLVQLRETRNALEKGKEYLEGRVIDSRLYKPRHGTRLEVQEIHGRSIGSRVRICTLLLFSIYIIILCVSLSSDHRISVFVSIGIVFASGQQPLILVDCLNAEVVFVGFQDNQIPSSNPIHSILLSQLATRHQPLL